MIAGEGVDPVVAVVVSVAVVVVVVAAAAVVDFPWIGCECIHIEQHHQHLLWTRDYSIGLLLTASHKASTHPTVGLGYGLGGFFHL